MAVMVARVALVASGFPPPLTPPPCAGEGNQKTSPRPAGTPLLARRGAGGEDSYHEDIRRTAVASIPPHPPDTTNTTGTTGTDTTTTAMANKQNGTGRNDGQTPDAALSTDVQQGEDGAPENSVQKRRLPVISVRSLTKTYLLGQTRVRALRGVSLDIYPGEFVAIMTVRLRQVHLYELAWLSGSPHQRRILVDGHRRQQDVSGPTGGRAQSQDWLRLSGIQPAQPLVCARQHGAADALREPSQRRAAAPC